MKCMAVILVLLGACLASASPVTADFVGGDSDLFITTTFGLCQYDRVSEAVSLAPFATGWSFRDLAFDNGNNLYVATLVQGILRLSQDGSSITTFAANTHGEEYWGVTIGPDNSLYATDHTARQVQNFALDGTPLGTYSLSGIGSVGSLAFDTKGNLLIVADHSLLVFDPAFNPVTEKVVSPLHTPYGVAVRPDGLIYVAGGNSSAPDPEKNLIFVYDADYNFVKSFTGTDLTEPAQLAFDENSRLYASSTNLPEVVVFGPDDLYLRSIDLPSLPIGVAFERNTGPHFVMPAVQIPAPGAVLLGTCGIGLAGWLRRRRLL